MQHSARRQPVPSIDNDGRRVLMVPLANSDRYAKVLPEDYERLLSEGLSPNWNYNMGVVKVSDRIRNAPRLARLLMGVGPGDRVQVRHKDKDRLNCRSDNLKVLPVKTTNRAA